jgi:hypothetical protein
MQNRAIVLWSFAYLAVMAAVVAGLAVARQRVLATLDTPQARQEWREWMEHTARQQDLGGPVQRRPVRSEEPPAVILLRDRFPVIVVTTVMIGSFLIGFLVFVAKGAFQSRRPST